MAKIYVTKKFLCLTLCAASDYSFFLLLSHRPQTETLILVIHPTLLPLHMGPIVSSTGK